METQQANCDLGDVVMGGGHSVTSISAATMNYQILESLPLNGLPGWEIEMLNLDPKGPGTPGDDNNIIGLKAFAVCFDKAAPFKP